MFNSLAEFLQEKGHPQVYLNFYCQVKPLHTHKKNLTMEMLTGP